MLAAADVLVTEDAEQQDAEGLRDEVARRMRALEQQLGMRNPAANGPAVSVRAWRGARAVTSRAAVRSAFRVLQWRDARRGLFGSGSQIARFPRYA